MNDPIFRNGLFYSSQKLYCIYSVLHWKYSHGICMHLYKGNFNLLRKTCHLTLNSWSMRWHYVGQEWFVTAPSQEALSRFTSGSRQMCTESPTNTLLPKGSLKIVSSIQDKLEKSRKMNGCDVWCPEVLHPTEECTCVDLNSLQSRKSIIIN